MLNISFTYIINSLGHKTEPWATRRDTLRTSDLQILIYTKCFMLARWLVRLFTRKTAETKKFNIWHNHLLSTVSNADFFYNNNFFCPNILENQAQWRYEDAYSILFACNDWLIPLIKYTNTSHVVISERNPFWLGLN